MPRDYRTKSSTEEVGKETGLQRRAKASVHAPEAEWAGEEKGVIRRVQKQGLWDLDYNW